ncbi:MAG: hypothetical protein V4467_03125 [Patescibacteria group bacterium]
MNKTVLITGFRKFGVYRCNPTETLVENLKGKNLGGFQIFGKLFDSSMTVANAGPEGHCGEIISHLVTVFGASAVVSLGMWSTISGIRFESRCSNWVHNDKYCKSGENNRPIVGTRPPKEIIGLDLRPWNIPSIQKKLRRAEIPFEAEISQDAGGFCCNALMYLASRALKNHRRQVPFMFAHVPCTKEAVKGLSVEQFNPEGKVILTDSELETALLVILQNLTLAG